MSIHSVQWGEEHSGALMAGNRKRQADGRLLFKRLGYRGREQPQPPSLKGTYKAGVRGTMGAKAHSGSDGE